MKPLTKKSILTSLVVVPLLLLAQGETFFEVKKKLSGNPTIEEYLILDQWLLNRFSISEELGIHSFDSLIVFLPGKFPVHAGHSVLDYLEGGLSGRAYNIILDSIYNISVRANDFLSQCILLRYFDGKKLGNYKAEIDSAYNLAKKINSFELVSSITIFKGNYYLSKTKFDSAIYYYRTCLPYYLLDPKQNETCAALYNNLAIAYLRKGLVDSSLFYFKQAYRMPGDGTTVDYWRRMVNIANSFRLIGQYDSAIYYLNLIEKKSITTNMPAVKGRLYRTYTNLFCDVNNLEQANTNALNFLNYATFNKDTVQLIDAYASVSFVKQVEGKHDSAFYYSSVGIKLLKYKKDGLFNSALLLQHGISCLRLNKMDSAFYYVHKAFLEDSAIGASLSMARDIYEEGQFFLKSGDTANAFKKFARAKLLLRPVTDIALAKNIFSALSITSFALNNVYDAWIYQSRFMVLNDSITAFKNMYALNELNTRYKLNDEKIKVNNLLLRSQRNKFWMIIGGIFFLLILVVLIVFRIIEKNKTSSSIKQAQQKALRSQLNPHFIFNVMQSVRNEYAMSSTKGEELLIGFSTLIREILDRSFSFEGTLEEEINFLEKYIAIQSKHASLTLNFNIEIDDAIVPEETSFPSLALQPIVENAIKYGPPQNNIVLRINKNKFHLTLTVENGLPEHHNVSSNSFVPSSGTGLQLTEERIDLFNKKYNTKGGLQSIKNDSKFVTTITLAYVKTN